ncbi:hypothetical protein QFZ37_003767 [Chryseobacterium ginsenosidimutans]|uniref:bacteriocin-like protein n=1 Tax=Chryseobacterium ginsenosidimutans TaxID=687846 RepID=UPI002785E1A4|nr:hypothetical protein [Chryseobacterium ginsenosidimutans]MDQ0595398.1 hypothetical protein [Chryseobacterium ginsenosidimutans]
MKNLKKLSREQLKTVSGGAGDDKFYGGGGGCHCHGCGPSKSYPDGFPPKDFDANSSTDCWAQCDRYRSSCGQ